MSWDYRKHLVQCPHCKKDVLDHMTECPFCKGALTPGGLKPLDPEKLKRVKLILNIVGFAVIAAFIVWAIVSRYAS